MPEPLPPCPFCGGTSLHTQDDEAGDRWASEWWVQCDGCGARGPVAKIGPREHAINYAIRAKYREQAQALWAARHDEDAAEDAELNAIADARLASGEAPVRVTLEELRAERGKADE